MSWIQKLYDTYEKCNGAPQFERDPLLPVSHSRQQAHLDVVLNVKGDFLRARVLPKPEIVIQVTEDSAVRVGTKPPPHPLCDKVQYCAGDYSAYGGTKPSFYREYVEQLEDWCTSPHTHQKIKAVLHYVQKGTLVKDLVQEKVLFCDSTERRLATDWPDSASTPQVFRFLLAKNGVRDQGDLFIRWCVEIPDNPQPVVSDDPDVRDAWTAFDAENNGARGLCMVTGLETSLTTKHPKRLRHPADGAKLISSNDEVNFTFRGRFRQADEACGVGFEVSQKAHAALQWLIKRQGERVRNGDQVFVAWSVGGEDVPQPMLSTAQLMGLEPVPDASPGRSYTGDAGQRLALQLNKLMTGYKTQLGSTTSVVVIGLDSASPGRMAMIYYRELTGSEFLARLEQWHRSYAWPQSYGKLHFLGAPAPTDIAEAAYSVGTRRLDEKLSKATVERLVPCIIDSAPVPRDIVESIVRKVSNRNSFKTSELWNWEKRLGIACGLYRGYRKEKQYQMSLEESRTSRDYLYGRLLAIADHLESRALYVAKEARDTNAMRLMQRFASHPYTTWRTLELALKPSEARLRVNRPPTLFRLQQALDEVMNCFAAGDFANDRPLSGEFLLGFHCQRAALWEKPESSHIDAGQNNEEEQGENGNE